MSMKINKLEIENVKRIKAVKVLPVMKTALTRWQIFVTSSIRYVRNWAVQ